MLQKLLFEQLKDNETMTCSMQNILSKPFVLFKKRCF